MAESDCKLAYVSNGLLSEFEKRAVDIISYQFTQYQGLYIGDKEKDWRTLAAGLGFNTSHCVKYKVRINETEIDYLDQVGDSLHEKLHLLINRFVLNCRLVGLQIDLVEHLLEILKSGLFFHTPCRILAESIVYEKLKY